ncbi:hypothetical protein JKP88DRAFT_284085 [Tribonema minus]|uniref:Uncharacterized protein n=1 Tax=Tribonema minus TaxID=303371 RepID=A0A835YPP2_9STRA|nr:hypothetical protein JKP88DRAFT_284085 [Tribonema minus]
MRRAASPRTLFFALPQQRWRRWQQQCLQPQAWRWRSLTTTTLLSVQIHARLEALAAALAALLRERGTAAGGLHDLQSRVADVCSRKTAVELTAAPLSTLQRLMCYAVMSDMAAALPWACDPRAAAAAHGPAEAAVALQLADCALQTLYTLLHASGGARFRHTAAGIAAGPLDATAAECVDSALRTLHTLFTNHADIGVQLPPVAMPGAVCAHFVWGAHAAEMRMALEADTVHAAQLDSVEGIAELFDPDSAFIVATTMASRGVDAYLQGQFRECRRFALLAAAVDACGSLGATFKEETLGFGARFFMHKEASALKFSTGDLAGALGGYFIAHCVIMVCMMAARQTLPPHLNVDAATEQCADVALELGKVSANMSLIELRMGDADAALECAEAAITAAPSWFKAHVRHGAALSALRRHTEASAAYAVAAELAPAPRDAADCRRQEDAQLQLAHDAHALQGIQEQLQQQQLRAPPGHAADSSGTAAADSAPVPGAATAAAAAAAAASASKLASVGPVLRALQATTQDAALALAGYMRPADLARLERTCRFFGARPLRRRMRVRRTVRCQPARSLGHSAAAAAAAATSAAAAAAAAAVVEAASRAYCNAATDADARVRLEALAAALAALVRACGAAAESTEVAAAMGMVVCADAPAAERCAFWRACAAEVALHEPHSLLPDVCAAKYLLCEPTAAWTLRARCMQHVMLLFLQLHQEFQDLCRAETLGGAPASRAEYILQELTRYVAGDMAAALRWACSPASAAAAAAECAEDALHTLFMLLHGYGGLSFTQTAVGAAATRHVRDFATLHAALPPRWPAVRAPIALNAQQRAETAAQLPPDATLDVVRTHFAWGADAAEVRAALEADPRMLRVWRVTLPPMGPWLAQNRWGHLTALAALALVNVDKSDHRGCAIAEGFMLAAYLLLRGEEWGSGALAQAAFERAVSSVEGLAELFAGYYRMVRDYSYALPHVDARAEEIFSQQQA